MNSQVRCIRYCLKLTRMNESKLSLKAYRMLLELDERGKGNWVSRVRYVLSSHGFVYEWEGQGVGSIDLFVENVKAKVN